MPNDNLGGAAAAPGTTVPGIRPPQPLNFDSNVAENWKIFKQKWNNYAIIAKLNTQEEPYRVALFLHTLGDEALKVFNGFKFETPEANRTVGEIIEQFEKFAVGETNETYERYVFNSRTQGETESFETFLAAVRSLSKTCNYCDGCIDSIIRDRIVLGIRDPETQTALLKERKLTLPNCIDLCKAAENATSQGKALRPEKVNKVEEKVPAKNMKSRRASGRKGQGTIKECKFCGREHPMRKEECPAWGKTCSACGRMNHFGKMCSEKQQSQPKKTKKPVKRVYYVAQETSTDESSEEEEWVNATKSTTGDSREIRCLMLVGENKKEVVFQVDTGASVNVIPKQFVKNIKPTSTTLKVWNNENVSPLGTSRCRVKNPKNGKKNSVEFITLWSS